MKSFNLGATNYTPQIILDPERAFFEFAGVSLPEDVVGFYSPIIEWIEDYEEFLKNQPGLGNQVLTFEFRLCYYNSGTVRFLISVFQKIKKMSDLVAEIKILWFYEKDDLQLLDNGKELAEITGLKFEFNEV